MALTILPINVTSISPSIVDHAGPLLPVLPWVIALRLPGRLNGLILTLHPRYSFLVNCLMKAAMVVMLELLMSGSIRTILLIRLAHLIKHLGMIMVLVALPRSNARTVFQGKDAGLKNELKFIQSMNLAMWKGNKIWWTRFINEDQLLAPLLLPKNWLTILEVFSMTKLEEKN